MRLKEHSMRLAHMKITTRLAAGFGSLILLGAGVAIYAVVQLTDVRGEVDRMQSLAANVQRVLDASQFLEAQRRAEFEYGIDADDTALQESRAAQGAALALLHDTAKDVASAAQRRALDAVSQAVLDHQRTVDGFVALSDQVSAENQKVLADSATVMYLMGQISDLAQATQNIDLQNAAGDVERSLLLVRVSQWRNSVATKPQGLMNFKRAAFTAQAAMNGLERMANSDVKPLLPQLRSALTTYTQTFSQSFADRLSMLAVLDGQMRPQIVALVARLHDVSDAMKADFAASARSGNRALSTTSLIQQILAAATVLIGALLALLIGRGISRPLSAIESAMRRLARGELTVDVPGLARQDEIGSMAEAVNVFKANAVRAREAEDEAARLRQATEAERMRNEAERAREAAEDSAAIGDLGTALDALAHGRLSYQISSPFAPKTEQLKTDFNITASRLRETMSAIAQAIETIRHGTGDMSQAADDLSRRTAQQAASLEETAAALDEITVTVKRTAEGAIHARSVATTASGTAEQSGKVVRDAIEAMNGIEKSSGQIGQIIGVIDEIAFQTNLLALNAGVEAARAGEAGRGFAVVASEVRALAQRSAEAAKEIKALIAASTHQVGQGVDLVAQTGRALDQITLQVTELRTIVADIAASAQEQATGLGQVNTTLNQMDQVTQQNAAMVEESTAASHSLAQETDEVSRLIMRFDLGQAATARKSPTPMRRTGRLSGAVAG
jgi:methyl-accepting chemotaxis protein